MRISGVKASFWRSNSQSGTRRGNCASVAVMALVIIVLIAQVLQVNFVDNYTVENYDKEVQNKFAIIRTEGNLVEAPKDIVKKDVSTVKQTLKLTNRTNITDITGHDEEFTNITGGYITYITGRDEEFTNITGITKITEHDEAVINSISKPFEGISSTASVLPVAKSPMAVQDAVKETNNNPKVKSKMIFVHSTYNKDTKRNFKNLPRGRSNLCPDDFKSRHLITSSPDGRIGNQLFELCTLIAAANDSCYTAVYKPETFSLDSIFEIQNIVRTNFSEINFGKAYQSVWGLWQSPIHEIITPDKNWTLSGYHQSFKYFQHRKELVRSSLIFKDHIKRDVMDFFKANTLYSKIKVGIHVRRGDFLDKSKLDHGYFPSSLQFINNAMNYYTYKLNSKDVAFVFVSDNITWCQENFKLKNVYFSPFKDPGTDLYILTQCDHNIVTTGTFGWMGAWINETGTVIYDKSYPKRQSILWYGHLKEHYYPDWWIGL